MGACVEELRQGQRLPANGVAEPRSGSNRGTPQWALTKVHTESCTLVRGSGAGTVSSAALRLDAEVMAGHTASGRRYRVMEPRALMGMARLCLVSTVCMAWSRCRARCELSSLDIAVRYLVEHIEMLKVTIELLPYGDQIRTQVLGEMTISNAGGADVDVGDYDVVLTEYHVDRAKEVVSQFRTVARIEGLERDILRPAQLVGAALNLVVPLKRTMQSSSDPYGVVLSRQEV